MEYEKNLEDAGAYDDLKKADKVKTYAGIAAAFIVFITMLTMPAIYLMTMGFPSNQTTLFFSRMISFDIVNFVNDYFIILAKSIYARGAYEEYIYFIYPFFAGGLVYLVITSIFKFNKTPNIFGDAHYAKEEDIVRMDAANIISNKRGELMVLGFFKKKMLRLTNHLSVLMLAPPGTGKTVGFIVPSIVNMDRVSIMVHDMKPELFTLTSGWRNRLGPCYEFKWSAIDYPEGRWIEEYELPLCKPFTYSKR